MKFATIAFAASAVQAFDATQSEEDLKASFEARHQEIMNAKFDARLTELTEEWHTDHLFENGKCSSVSSTS